MLFFEGFDILEYSHVMEERPHPDSLLKVKRLQTYDPRDPYATGSSLGEPLVP